ncbi:hypothetical protein [Limnohabitans sp.]|uniref:hypothetical protein n=1 Tax=Limnohabitans sp. TaxID=1907725 RepID=UPI0033402201
MSPVRLSSLVISLAAWGLVCSAFAQNPQEAAVQTGPPALPASPPSLDVPAEIARQRQAVAAVREAILKSDEQRQAACWQKFAVNACLIETRRIRRQALDPLAQQDLVLNAQEREWRSAQREQRLLGKQPETQAVP